MFALVFVLFFNSFIAMEKQLVVCINALWTPARIPKRADAKKPIEGEIYEVTGVLENPILDGMDYYRLKGFINGYETSHFRPTDDTFGEIVAENLKKQIEYEKVLQS